MSGSAARASKYAKMIINKDGKTANIAGKLHLLIFMRVYIHLK